MKLPVVSSFPVATAIIAAAALFQSGCVSDKTKPASGATGAAKPATSDSYIVTAESTPFFKLGPAQGGGADLDLKKDTRVKLVKRGFGYSTVELETGQRGMLATQDIKPAPPEPPAPATPTQPSPLLHLPTNPGGQPSSAIIKQYTIDETGNPVLPLAPLPAPEDTPKLRY